MEMENARYIIFSCIKLACLCLFCSISNTLFGQCITGSVTFRVDMRNEIVDPLGVYIAGAFQGAVGQTNWTPVPMCDLGSGIWEMTYCGVPTGLQTYKFLNGPGGWEFDASAGGAGVPGACNTGVGFNDREVVITGGTQIEGPYCFNTCDILCSSPDPGGSDNIFPTILNVPSDVTLDCALGLPAPDCLLAMDNCFANCSTDLPIDDLSALNACGFGDVIRSWTVVDAFGNSTTESQTITLEDNQEPIIDASGIMDITVSCGSIPPGSNLPATDDCDVNVTEAILIEDGSGLDACGLGLVIRTWNASDCSGNDAPTITQLITVEDNDPPVIDASGIMDITVSCDAVPPVSNLPASDNCDASISIAVVFEDASGLDPCGLGLRLRSWDVSDCSGNAAITITQQITVEDNSPPLIDGSLAPDITVSCGMIPPPPAITSSDNCDATAGNPNLIEDNSGIDACGLGVLIRTWAISDCSGNAATPHVQTITVEDMQGPVMTAPADITISCEDPLPPLNVIAASDNCDATVTSSMIPTDDLSGLDACSLGDIVRTWMASDCAGNSTTVSQRIMVEDNDAPTFDEVIPSDISITCDDPLPPSLDLLASDACDASVIASSFPIDNTSGLDQNGVGILIRTWTVVDCAGNVNTADQLITIEGVESEFTLLTSYCVLDDTWYTLPTVSDNGVIGSWGVFDFNPTVLGEGFHTFIFEPNIGECGSRFTLEIEVTGGQQPIFELDTSFCVSDLSEYILNSSSLNGIPGAWTIDRFVPNVLGPGSFQSTFVPFDPTCTGSYQYNFTVDSLTKPLLPSVGPFCAQLQDTIVLDSTSLNLIEGVWNIDTIIPIQIGPDSFDLIYTPLSDQCALPDTQKVVISDAVNAQFASLGPFCSNTDSTIILPDTSENRIVGAWVPASFNPSSVNGNSFTAEFTPQEGQCASMQSITIDVEDAVEPFFDPFDVYCIRKDTNIVLPSISSNGISGSWDTPIINPSTESIGSRNIRFTPEENTCAEVFETTIQFVDYDIQIATNPEFCEGSDVALTISGDAALSYLWTGPNAFTSSMANPMINGITMNQSGQYCVIAEYIGCSIEQCLDLNILERPALTIDSSQCFDNTYNLFISINQDATLSSNFGLVSMTGPNTYQILDIPNDQTIEVTLMSNNNLACETIEQIDAPQCSCANPAIITSFTSSQSQACLGDSIFFTALIGGGATSISWDYDQINAEGIEDNLSLVLIPQVVGTYEVTIETNDPDGMDDACSSTIERLFVEVFDSPPPPSVSNNNVLYCRDSLASVLEAQGDNLRWYDANNQFIGNSPPLPATNLIGSTTYFVSQTINTCESPVEAITVTIENCGCQDPVSILNFSVAAQELCLGDPVNVEVDIDNNDYQGSWTVLPAGSGTFQDPNALATTFLATSEGTYQIVYTTEDPDGSGDLCEADQRSSNLIVHPLTPLPNSEPSISLCLGDIALPLVATGTNVLWYDENQNLLGDQAPIPSTTSTGVQIFFVSQELNNCTSDLLEIQVEVVNCDCVDPSTVLDIQSSEDTICIFEEIILIAEVSNNNFSGFWYLNGVENASLQDLGGGEVSFVPQESGVQNIAYIIDDPDGDGPCEASSFNLDIFVDELNINLQVEDVDCYDNGNIYFDIGGLLPYTLSNSAGEVLMDTVEDLSEGTYSFFIQTRACSETINLDILDTGIDEELDDKTFFINSGESINLIPDLGLGEVDSFEWNTSIYFSTVEFAPQASPEEDIIYELTMYQGSCLITQRFIVQVNTVRPEIDDFMPNVFAPNGSGTNASFGLIDGAPYSDIIEFKIWDRWGNLIHNVSNLSANEGRWDGRRDGTSARIGVYIYRITAIHQDGEVETSQGDLLLMR